MAYFNLRSDLQYDFDGCDFSVSSQRQEHFNLKQREIVSSFTRIEVQELIARDWIVKSINKRTIDCRSPSGLRLNAVFPKNATGHFPLDTTQMKTKS